MKLATRKRNIFDARSALKSLNGKTFKTGQALREELSKVIWKHRHQLTVDFKVQEFVEIIRKNGWLITESEALIIRLPSSKD